MTVNIKLPEWKNKYYFNEFVIKLFGQLSSQQIDLPSLPLLFELPHLIIGLYKSIDSVCKIKEIDATKEKFHISLNELSRFVGLFPSKEVNLRKIKRNVRSMLELLRSIKYENEFILKSVTISKSKDIFIEVSSCFTAYYAKEIVPLRDAGGYLTVTSDIYQNLNLLKANSFCLFVEKLLSFQKKILSDIDSEYFKEMVEEDFILNEDIISKLFSLKKKALITRKMSLSTENQHISYQKDINKHVNRCKKNAEIYLKNCHLNEAKIKELAFDSLNSGGLKSAIFKRRQKNEFLLSEYKKIETLNPEKVEYSLNNNSNLNRSDRYILMNYYEFNHKYTLENHITTHPQQCSQQISDSVIQMNNLEMAKDVLSPEERTKICNQFIELNFDESTIKVIKSVKKQHATYGDLLILLNYVFPVLMKYDYKPEFILKDILGFPDPKKFARDALAKISTEKMEKGTFALLCNLSDPPVNNYENLSIKKTISEKVVSTLTDC